MWKVYVLLCEDGSLYTGCTNNIEKRFHDHVAGNGAKYTRSHKPRMVIFQETFPTRSDALKREYEIKSWSREEKIKMLKIQLPSML